MILVQRSAGLDHLIEDFHDLLTMLFEGQIDEFWLGHKLELIKPKKTKAPRY